MTSPKAAPCVDCGTEHGALRRGIPLRVRGLCGSCYQRHAYNRDLDDYPRTSMPAADLIEDLEIIADAGGSLTEAMTRLGKTKAALWQATKRAGRRDIYRTLADREPWERMWRSSWKETAS